MSLILSSGFRKNGSAARLIPPKPEGCCPAADAPLSGLFNPPRFSPDTLARCLEHLPPGMAARLEAESIWRHAACYWPDDCERAKGDFCERAKGDCAEK